MVAEVAGNSRREDAASPGLLLGLPQDPRGAAPCGGRDALGPGPTASSSDQGSEGVEIFEVACKKPLGLQLREKPGRGVEVALVYEGSKAAQLGVRAGDLIVATSASLGSQMWEKKTLAGVESAIQTRVDGIVRLARNCVEGSLRAPHEGAGLGVVLSLIHI